MSDSLCDKLDDFLGNCLSDRERAAFEAHLATCGDCRREIRDQQHIDRLLASATGELGSVPSALTERIERRIQAQSRRRAVWRVGVVAAAATLLLACGVWFATSHRGTRVAQVSPPGPEQAHPTVVPQETAASSPQGANQRSLVRLTFERGSDAIAVPIESADPNVSIFWIYPTVHAPKPPTVPDPIRRSLL